MRGGFLRYDPRLIEEAVFLALRDHPDADYFYRHRNRLYEVESAGDREREFQDLNRCWFIRLRLAESIEKAVGEQPALIACVKLCILASARKKSEEGAELFVVPQDGVRGKERPTLRILLRPESLLKPSELLTFLRHELLHITDMLDPAFGYQPVLMAGEGGPAHDALLRGRYRVLWDATIDGRMVRRGWLQESARMQHLVNFASTFPMLGEQTETLFRRFFDREPHTHGELAAFALDPGAATPTRTATPYPGSRCPLCRLPTHVFKPDPEALEGDITIEINRDFPAWDPSQGICNQCADLYRARKVSLAALAQLPGATPVRS